MLGLESVQVRVHKIPARVSTEFVCGLDANAVGQVVAVLYIPVYLPEPVLHVLEAVVVSDVVNNKNAMCAAIITLCDCAESFLPCSVPDLNSNA